MTLPIRADAPARPRGLLEAERGLSYGPGEWAKCPKRRSHGSNRSHMCGGDVALLAGPETVVHVRVLELRLKPGEAMRFCKKCDSKLAVRTEVASPVRSS